jgi:Flp pilus assembly pilin Flp
MLRPEGCGRRWMLGRPRTAGSRGRELGQGIVEYGLILGLMAVVAIVILVFFGDTLAQILAAIGSAIDHPA